MRKRLSHIWRGFRELFSTQTLETTVESGKAVLEGAKTLQEQGKNLELLKPLVEQSSSLLEVLCSPTVQVVGANLTDVNFSRAALFSTNLNRADLKNVSWDENTKWEDVQGLETALNVPEALRQKLGLE